MTNSDFHRSADSASEREIWTTCEACCGEGGIEEPRPQFDDPHFAIVRKCECCGGSGWECQ